MTAKEEIGEVIGQIEQLHARISQWPQAPHRDGALGGLGSARWNLENGRESIEEAFARVEAAMRPGDLPTQ